MKNIIFSLFFFVISAISLLQATEPAHNPKMYEVENCNFLYGSLAKTEDEIKKEKDPATITKKIHYKQNLKMQIKNSGCKELLKKK